MLAIDGTNGIYIYKFVFNFYTINQVKIYIWIKYHWEVLQGEVSSWYRQRILMPIKYLSE